MPWQCRLIEYNPEVKREIGDMWYADENGIEEFRLSDYYLNQWKGKRLPLYVMTPGGSWCVDQKPTSGGVPQPGGWQVTGEAPNITAMPSININGYYHGWLQNGILTDDCEGRVFK